MTMERYDELWGRVLSRRPKVTQGEVARRMGVSEALLSLLLAGRRPWQERHVILFARATGLAEKDVRELTLGRASEQ